MTLHTIPKTLSVLLTCSILACAPVLAQTDSGGSAGDGDKPLNPANKTTPSTTLDATKDINGKPTAKTPHPIKRAHKMRKQASSAMSSAASSLSK